MRRVRSGALLLRHVVEIFCEVTRPVASKVRLSTESSPAERARDGATFARTERQRLESGALDAQGRYWAEQMRPCQWRI